MESSTIPVWRKQYLPIEQSPHTTNRLGIMFQRLNMARQIGSSISEPTMGDTVKRIHFFNDSVQFLHSLYGYTYKNVEKLKDLLL